MTTRLVRLRRLFPQLDQMHGQLEGLLELVDAEFPDRNDSLIDDPDEAGDADLVEDLYSTLERALENLNDAILYLEPTPQETQAERLASLEHLSRMLENGAIPDAKRMVASIIEKEGKNG